MAAIKYTLFRSTLRECYALGSWSHDRQVLSLFGATCVRVETLRLHTWDSGATGLRCRDSGLQLFSPQAVSDRVSGLVQTSVLLTLHVLQRRVKEESTSVDKQQGGGDRKTRLLLQHVLQ